VALNPSISPLVPVLRSNLWLTVHVLTITLSYGAFFLAWALGHVVVGSMALTPENKDRQANLSQYLYRTLQIGVVLLAAGTILGGVWANYSWGRFWGWDPKENGALMIILWELTILHARIGGYIRDRGVCISAIILGCIVAFSWWGVNLLGVGFDV